MKNRQTINSKIHVIFYGILLWVASCAANPVNGRHVADDVFYHPELRSQFPVPSGCKRNNTPSQVQIVSKKRDGLILFSLKRGRSPEAVARQFIAKSNARVIRFDAIMVNGLPAQRLMAYLAVQKGPLLMRAYFIQKGEHVYLFQGVTSHSLENMDRFLVIPWADLNLFPTQKGLMWSLSVSAFVP